MPTNTLRVLATIALSALLVIGAILLLGRLQGTVIVLIAAIFFAYLIYPLIRILQRKMPMLAAILVVYAGIALVVAVVVVFFVPPLVSDTTAFVRSVPHFVAQLQSEIADPHNEFFSWLPTQIRDYVANLPSQMVGLIQTYGFDVAHQVATYLFSVVAVIATVIIIPILTAYMLLDFDNILRTVLGLFPTENRAKAKAVLLDLDRVLGGFIRGQLLDAMIVGALIFVVLIALRVPFAYLIAVFTGVFQIVPYLGALVGFVPAVVLALLNNGPASAIFVAIAIAAIHQVDGNFIAPRIMRGTVGLAPVWVILAVLVFTEMFGIVGTFVAVPVAAMLRVMKMHFLPPPIDEEEAHPLEIDDPLRLGDAIAPEEIK